jgi:hypothetical protein
MEDMPILTLNQEKLEEDLNQFPRIHSIGMNWLVIIALIFVPLCVNQIMGEVKLKPNS